MGENIEKIFYEEIRKKKLVGSNIYKRVSTRKGGGRQALRTPYLYMSNKEKKKLNGEVISMNELLSIDELKEKDLDTQKSLMEYWRDKYTIKKITDALGIADQTYYNLLDSLKVEREIRATSFIEVSDEELIKLKNDFASYDKIMSLPTHQRYEVLPIYYNMYSDSELAEGWNVNKQKVYSLKYQMNNYIEKKNGKVAKREKNKVDAKKHKADRVLRMSKLHDAVQEKKEQIVQAEKIVTPIISTNSDFLFKINQTGVSGSIAKKLEMIMSFLEEDENYEISLTIQKT